MSTILTETLEQPLKSAGPLPAAMASSFQRLDEKRLRLDWVMREFRDGIASIELGQIPAAPLQIEVHPYHCSQPLPCNNRCV
jgi:hypothetical protein